MAARTKARSRAKKPARNAPETATPKAKAQSLPDADAFERIWAIATALDLPGLERGTSYGAPSMKVKGKFLGWVNRQGHFAVKCEYDMKAVLMQARSGLYFETPHYEGYDLVLVSLERAKDKDIAEAVKRAWEYVAGQAKGGL